MSHQTFPVATDRNTTFNGTPDTINGTTNGTTMKDVQNTVVNNAASAVNAVQNHPITQNLVNGPAATSVKNQAAATSDELSGLANSRQAPAYTAANGETLTHYHSFFYSLLSWQHPRATGIAFASAIAFIFACRYLPILKYAFQTTYWVLGLVSLAEVAGKLALGSGFATSIRPRKYYKISKETMETSLDDVEQLINFFVIEAQRIVFAENVGVTGAAAVAAFLGYYLIKILPFWGLSLLTTSVVFLGPLIYISNQELIDGHLTHASNVVSAQASQVKDLASEHTGKAFESIKSSTSDYTDKASSMIGQSRQKIPSMDQAKAAVTGNTTNPAYSSNTVNSGLSEHASNPTYSANTGSTGFSSNTVNSGLSEHTSNPTYSANTGSTGFSSSTGNTGINEETFPTAPHTQLPSTASTTLPTVHAPIRDEPIATSY